MIKRACDIFFSLTGLALLLPFFILVGLLIVIADGFPVFYGQMRVGKNGKDFRLYKFRTMVKDADKKGLITVGGKDNRITRTGYFLRKYKIDELPQLFNVLIGNMSLVGPRPEVRKYVELYNEEQRKVLLVKPGITDPASIAYSSENELLGKSSNPDATYINEIMPAKLKLNLEYISQQSLKKDIIIIFRTLLKIISK